MGECTREYEHKYAELTVLKRENQSLSQPLSRLRLRSSCILSLPCQLPHGFKKKLTPPRGHQHVKAIHPVRKKVRVLGPPLPPFCNVDPLGWGRDDPMCISQHCRMGGKGVA